VLFVSLNSIIMQAAEFFQDVDLVNKLCDLLGQRLFKASCTDKVTEDPCARGIYADGVRKAVPHVI
jgi:hypothetical protein